MNNRARTFTALSGGLLSTALLAAVASSGTTTAVAVPGHAGHGASHGTGHGQHATTSAPTATQKRDLAQVRRATARFHDVDAAIAAGYERGWVNGSGVRIIAGCVANPTAGAMGYHYFNKELMADDEVNLLEPEVLVYATGDDGELQLVAVEWAARGPNSNPPGPAEPPIVMGMEMHILVPAVGFHIMHAWVWKPNPAGMFEDWNPKVSCP